MTSGRVMELCRTFPGSYLGYSWFIDGDKGQWLKHWAGDVVPLFAAPCVTIKLFFPSFWGLLYLRYLALLVIGGYGETDWPML